MKKNIGEPDLGATRFDISRQILSVRYQTQERTRRYVVRKHAKHKHGQAMTPNDVSMRLLRRASLQATRPASWEQALNPALTSRAARNRETSASTMASLPTSQSGTEANNGKQRTHRR